MSNNVLVGFVFSGKKIVLHGFAEPNIQKQLCIMSNNVLDGFVFSEKITGGRYRVYWLYTCIVQGFCYIGLVLAITRVADTIVMLHRCSSFAIPNRLNHFSTSTARWVLNTLLLTCKVPFDHEAIMCPGMAFPCLYLLPFFPSSVALAPVIQLPTYPTHGTKD